MSASKMSSLCIALCLMVAACGNPGGSDRPAATQTPSEVVAGLALDYAVPGEALASKAVAEGAAGFAAEQIRKNYGDMVAMMVEALRQDVGDLAMDFDTVATIPAKTVTVTIAGTGYPAPLGESKIKVAWDGTSYRVYWTTSVTMPNLSAGSTRLLVQVLKSGSETTIWMRYPDLTTPFDLKAYYSSDTNAYKGYQGAYTDLQNSADSDIEKWMTLSTSGSLVSISYKYQPQDAEHPDWTGWGDATRVMIAMLGQSPAYIVNNSWASSDTDPAFFAGAPNAPSLGDGGWAATAADRSDFLAQNGTIASAATAVQTELGL